jgi:glucose/mannose-6-phosphate isomerase
MLQELIIWPTKLLEGKEIADDFYRQHQAIFNHSYKKIVLWGMGGSGMAARVVQALFEKKSSIPIFVQNASDIPAYVDSDTLCIMVSYSGETWEVVSAFNELAQKKVPLMVISHKGTLAQRAQVQGIPSVLMPLSLVPRLALGNFLGFLLGLFDCIGLCSGQKVLTDWYEQSAFCVSKFSDQSFFNEFLYAVNGYSSFHIWGVSGDSAACSFRAQTQFNENAKIPTVAAQIPELCHNLIEGFGNGSEAQFVLLLHTDFLPPSLMIVIDSLHEIIHEKGSVLYKAPIFGDTWENQLISLIIWADFASYYLGKTRNSDVTATPVLNALKERIRRKGLKI